MSTGGVSGFNSAVEFALLEAISAETGFGFDSVRTPSAEDEYCDVSLLLSLSRRGVIGDGIMLKIRSKALFSKLPDSGGSMLFSFVSIGGEAGPPCVGCRGLVPAFLSYKFLSPTRSGLTPSGSVVNRK